MKLTIYGAGYVGLVSAVCFAHIGHEVLCFDIDKARIEQLNQGTPPIYEVGLTELLQEVLASGTLKFTDDPSLAVSFSNTHFIATGTPSLPDGQADLSQVYEVAKWVARLHQGPGLLITKSTVPVGTGEKIAALIQKTCAMMNKPCQLQVASNPEFLKEGSAIKDFLEPDRIIVGGEPSIFPTMNELYQPLVRQGKPLLKMNLVSAELTKYAANSMLALRVSFMNQISQIADKVGADIEDLKKGLALDPRIGNQFLNPGIGYGGSCFPKDVRALIHIAQSLNLNSQLFQDIDSINEHQKQVLVDKLKAYFPSLKGKTIAIWGLAFKPGTDDLREASSLVMVDLLLKQGANLRLHDPIALQNAQKLYENRDMAIEWCKNAEDVFTKRIDALLIATEWEDYKKFPLQKLQSYLNDAPLFDGRNCYSLSDIKKADFAYYASIGRQTYKRPGVSET